MELKDNKVFKPYMPLDIQFFAEGDPPTDPPQDPPTDPPATPPTPEGAGKTFTQEDVDRIVKERLEREKRKADEKAEQARKEAERKALEEQGKYKEMYEALQKDLQAQKAQVLEARKETLLLGAGYTQEQANRYKKFLTGETEEELATALTALIEDIPPKASGVDPATHGNGQRQTPPAEEPYAFGKSIYERLKKSGRLR